MEPVAEPHNARSGSLRSAAASRESHWWINHWEVEWCGIRGSNLRCLIHFGASFAVQNSWVQLSINLTGYVENVELQKKNKKSMYGVFFSKSKNQQSVTLCKWKVKRNPCYLPEMFLSRFLMIAFNRHIKCIYMLVILSSVNLVKQIMLLQDSTWSVLLQKVGLLNDGRQF